jgi:opacity protein-like surface antigen
MNPRDVTSRALAAATGAAMFGILTGQAYAQSGGFDGFYAGVTLGYDSYAPNGRNRFVDGGVEQFRYRFDGSATGFAGGLYGGYGRMLAPSLYLGGEFEVSLSSAAETHATAVAIGGNVYSARVRQRHSWGLTPTLRLGWEVVPALLLYGRAGVSIQRQSTELGATRNGLVTDSRTEGAWIAGPRIGLGAEYQLTNRIHLRGEWNYTWLSSNEFSSRDATLGTPVPNVLRVSPNQNALRFSIGYRF